MIPDPGTKLLDSLVYGAAITAIATLLVGVAALATGRGLVTVKIWLFLLGFLLFGYASIALWLALSSETRGDSGTERARRKRSPFESTLARIAPAVEGLVPLEERFPPSLKLFIASLMVLGLSLVLEVVFDVGADSGV